MPNLGSKPRFAIYPLNSLEHIISSLSLSIDFLMDQRRITEAPPEVVLVLNGSRDVSAGP